MTLKRTCFDQEQEFFLSKEHETSFPKDQIVVDHNYIKRAKTASKNDPIAVGSYLKDVEKDDYEKVSEHIANEKVNVNATDNEGRNSLHWAAYNGNKDIVSLLLGAGVDALSLTKKGNTLLHLATSKGRKEVIEVLLKRINSDELTNFINARTFRGGATAIHIAAKNGFFDIVKSLLKNGAIHDTKNAEGKTPLEVSVGDDITMLLSLCKELFEDAKIGNPKIITKLQNVKPDEFVALTGTRNAQYNMLLQVIVANNHENIATSLFNLLKESDESVNGSEWRLDKIRNLVGSAKLHLEFSELYLPKLRCFSEIDGSEENLARWSTLKEGSYYLGNAYSLVKRYKNLHYSLINDKNIQAVNDMLQILKFDRRHMNKGYTREAYGGKAECFVSTGKGTKYYELLHSKFKKDVRLFIKMAESYIDGPVMRFIKSLQPEIGG